jgi:uncharacterized protein YydD (DUF2326 family)
MILRVSADAPTFRTVEFQTGMNIVLADRAPTADIRESRNGLGKTTLIEIIHYCLGSRPRPGHVLRNPALSGWTFQTDLLLSGHYLSAARSTDRSNVVVVAGDLPTELSTTGRSVGRAREISVDEWTAVLGHLGFGLPRKSSRKYEPSFRSLISYLARREPDGYRSPFEHFPQQPTWDRQVSNAYLLGLAWEDAADWQVLRDRRRELDDLRRLGASSTVGVLFGSVGELEAQRLATEAQLQQQTVRLESFQVHPEYREIEQQASDLTRSIHEASNANFTDRELLATYESAVAAEQPPDAHDVGALYSEAGIALPDVVKRRLDDVRNFHESVIRNRRRYISGELDRIRARLAQRDGDIERMSRRRAELLTILQTHGALEEFLQLQRRRAETQRQLDDISNRIGVLRRADTMRRERVVEEARLEERARRDYDERVVQREAAIKSFNRYSHYLYNTPGSLVIDLTSSGYQFRVDIERSGSRGISNMKIFCYDLVLATKWARQSRSPGFLIHDSTIYDGVDERQVALALTLVNSESSDSEFQYICMLNSDELPEADLPKAFSLDSYVRIRLSDQDPSEGLLGIRF